MLERASDFRMCVMLRAFRLSISASSDLAECFCNFYFAPVVMSFTARLRCFNDANSLRQAGVPSSAVAGFSISIS